MQQANCQEAVVALAVWNAMRASADPQYRNCWRRGADLGTLDHRFWECPENEKIEAEDVKETQYYCRKKGQRGSIRVCMKNTRTRMGHAIGMVDFCLFT